MKKIRIGAAAIVAIMVVSACGNGNTSTPAPQTAAATTAAPSTEAPATTTKAATTAKTTTTTKATTTKATTTTTKATTTAPPEPEIDFDSYSSYYTEVMKGATFEAAWNYLVNTENVSSDYIYYNNDSGETIYDANEWEVDSVTVSSTSIVLNVSKRRVSDMVREAIIGKTYDKAYNILINNGASDSTITTVDDATWGIVVKSNWTVTDAEISESGGVLYAKVYLSRDKDLIGEFLGDLTKNAINSKIEKYSEDHPWIGGGIKAIFDNVTQ